MGNGQSASRFRSDRHRLAEGDRKAFKMMENAMSKRGLGYVAANGSKIKNYGEKRTVGHTES